MKNLKIYRLLCLLTTISFLMMACEENEVLPDHQTVGTSTATVAGISVSNETPAPGEQVTVTINYVNLSEDPAQRIQILEKIGEEGSFAELTSFDASSDPVNEEVTQTFTYTVPAVSETTVLLDMVLTSQREFPQRERAALSVQ